MPRKKLGVPTYRLGKKPGKKEWYILWWQDGKSRCRSTKTTDHDEAKRVFHRSLANLSKPEKSQENTLKMIFEGYQNARREEVIDFKKIEQVSNALMKWFGDVPVSMVSDASIQRYGHDMQKNGMKDGTINKHFTILRAALKWAERTDMIFKAPFVKLRAAPAPKERWLTREEVRIMRERCKSEHLLAFIKVTLATAGRKKAVLQLRWDTNIDFKYNVIDLRQPGASRRQKGRATVPMNREIRDYLKTLKKYAKTPYVIEHNGRQVGDIKTAWRTLIDGLVQGDEETGIKPLSRFKGVSPHTLRHTAATWASMDGESSEQIGKLLGHKNSILAEEVYIKYNPSYLKSTVRRLS